MNLTNTQRLRILYVSEPLSKLGDMAQGIALATFVYTLTQSGILFGLFLFLRFIPELVIGPYSGYLADRISRRTITTSVNVLLFLMSLLLIVYHEDYTIIVIITTLSSVIKIMYRPAFSSSLPHLVSSDDLPNINRWFNVLQSISRILGATLATFGIVSHNITLIFLFNGLTFLIAAITCWMSIPKNQRNPVQDNHDSDPESGTMMSALRYLFNNQKLLGLVFGSTLLWGCLALSDTLLVPTLGSVRAGGEDYYGFYRIISTVGMLVGAYLSLSWYKLFEKGSNPLIGFYIPIIFLSFFTILLPTSPFLLGYAYYFLIWVLMSLPNNLLEVGLLNAPDNIRGKIFALADAIDGILFSFITVALPFLIKVYDPSTILFYSPFPFLMIAVIFMISGLKRSKGQAVVKNKE